MILQQLMKTLVFFSLQIGEKDSKLFSSQKTFFQFYFFAFSENILQFVPPPFTIKNKLELESQR